MTIYSKYLQQRLLFYFAIVYSIFLFIIWLTQSLRFLELITSKGISFATFINVTAFLLLPMSYICIPLALFFACIITFASFEINNEILILKGSGVSCIEIYKSILTTLLLIFILHLGLSLYLLPKSYQGFKNMQYELREALINAVFEEGVFNTQNNSITVYVEKKIDHFKYRNIFIYDLRNKDKPITIIASYGELVDTPEGPGFVLQDGTHQLEDKETSQVTLGFFKTYSFILKINENNPVSRAIDVNEMFISQLLNKVGKNDQLIKNHKVSALQRVLWPIFNLILPMIVVLGICSNPSRRSTGFAKQLKVTFAGIIIVTILMFSNNLALKFFPYIYFTIIFVCSLCGFVIYKIRKV